MDNQTTKKVAICQSNYIPWKGYFDLINTVDEFWLYDDVQYTRRDWRNRNKIKTPHGTRWLTIPVIVKGKYHQKIRDTKIADHLWGKKHWAIIRQSYRNAKHFNEYKEIFEDLYLNTKYDFLSEINYFFIQTVGDILGIKTKIMCARPLAKIEDKTERLIEICKNAQATEYISGPLAIAYLNKELFLKEKIQITWMDYSAYSQYRQLFEPFEHRVSILDLIFNEGPQAPKFMKSFGPYQLRVFS